MEQTQSLQEMVLRELDWYMKIMKLDHQLTQCIRISSKWIKDLNISHRTIKILAENISSKISDISCSHIFANVSPRARGNKGENKQMGPHQIKKLLHS